MHDGLEQLEPRKLPTRFNPELRGALPDAEWMLLLQHLAGTGVDTSAFSYEPAEGQASLWELVLGRQEKQARIAIDYRDGLIHGLRVNAIQAAAGGAA